MEHRFILTLDTEDGPIPKEAVEAGVLTAIKTFAEKVADNRIPTEVDIGISMRQVASVAEVQAFADEYKKEHPEANVSVAALQVSVPVLTPEAKAKMN